VILEASKTAAISLSVIVILLIGIIAGYFVWNTIKQKKGKGKKGKEITKTETSGIYHYHIKVL
jgi:uncharacterized protein YneF (UPF0154 family)